MKKDLQSIIKKVADRYGLKYDETKKHPTVISENGTIEIVSKEKFFKAFDPFLIENVNE
ncbi:hypothetical protein [Bacillus smithii]|uniref:hypothetical protein n=1 Tax=Bacillus smithii TaxID=1479 RepID=UPI002E24B1DD|nr:hypothetical protein [Bacillus smithii]MED4929168.1 hypothetical protein [Bacillus smithii]